MLKNEICEVCGQPAAKHSQAWEHIRMILYRPKKVSTTRNDFGHFYGILQKTASSYSRSIPKIEEKIERIREQLDSIKEKLEELESKRDEIFTELNNADGNEDNSAFKDKAIIEDYDMVNKTISQKEHEISDKQRMVTTWENSLETINQKLDSYKKDTSLKKIRRLCCFDEKY